MILFYWLDRKEQQNMKGKNSEHTLGHVIMFIEDIEFSE
ncbi:hypothetical protein TIMEGRIFFIN_97 [Bacillus phage vB_BspH_TimeGriffin]|nr:hypothetical protein TIMEGRIFFIN_97 [Bacillus phage vB_BspH_TimeGriffin]